MSDDDAPDSVNLVWALARRIDCDNCGKPYSFIRGGHENATADDDDNESRWRREAIKAGRAAMESQLHAEHLGIGRCPHCFHLQAWMRLSMGVSIGARFAVGVAAAGVIAACVWALGLFEIVIAPGWPMKIFGAGSALSLAIAVPLGIKDDDTKLVIAHRADPRAKSDDNLRVAIAQAGEGQDPFMMWFRGAGEFFGDHLADPIDISFGLLDESATPLGMSSALSFEARKSRGVDGLIEFT